jgi:small-conductance mechanosensitive channel
MIDSFLQQEFFGNTFFSYLIFLVIILLGFIAIKAGSVIFFKRLRLWAERTEKKVYDFLFRTIERNIFPLLYYGLFYLAVKELVLNRSLSRCIDILGLIFLTVFSARFLLEIILFYIKKSWEKKEPDPSRKQTLDLIFILIKVSVWGIAVIIFLDNLGFKISTLLAGLGVGGVAIAFASQAILKDIFNYFTIFFDRPFEVGDFIITGDFPGTIEHIGIKTTRVRSLGGEQIIFSNSDLTDSRIRNYKRMNRRRVVFKIGGTYQTPSDKLREIPGIIKNIIESNEEVVFDRAHFSSYGDFSLIFEIVYYVLSSDYVKYMDIQQRINLAIMEEFEKQKIEFAYPTQTLFLNKTENTRT